MFFCYGHSDVDERWLAPGVVSCVGGSFYARTNRRLRQSLSSRLHFFLLVSFVRLVPLCLVVLEMAVLLRKLAIMRNPGWMPNEAFLQIDLWRR